MPKRMSDLARISMLIGIIIAVFGVAAWAYNAKADLLAEIRSAAEQQAERNHTAGLALQRVELKLREVDESLEFVWTTAQMQVWALQLGAANTAINLSVPLPADGHTTEKRRAQ